MVERYLPLAAMDKLFRQAGANRIADGAQVVLRDVLEDEISKVATLAVTFARHANRRTILEQDIVLALEQIKRER